MFGLRNKRGVSLLAKKPRTHRRKCTFESLEMRSLLSAGGLSEINAIPLAQALSTVSAPYTPIEIRQAYGFNNILFGSTQGNGAGQTIAIVDAYNDLNISSDLKAFDAKYGLSNPLLKIVNQNGSQTALPTANSGWGLEIALDVEWAHAVAPAANILLVEASSSYLSDLLTAVSYAATQAKVVSMSWGSYEFSSETAYDSYFSPQTHPGVTFVASSGDQGGMTIWPAVSPNVVAVGGTTLTISLANGTYTYSSEKSWSGSGGGLSLYEKEPSWQYAVQSSGHRSSPDVAYDANPSTGYAVYDTYGYSGWVQIGGTSAGAPQWAGLVAIVNQGRSSPLRNATSDLYSLSANPYYSRDFHDVTSGTAGRNRAGTGYDLVTGLGSPQVQNIISALAGSLDAVLVKSTANSTTTTVTSPWKMYERFSMDVEVEYVSAAAEPIASTNSLDGTNYFIIASDTADSSPLSSAIGKGQVQTLGSLAQNSSAGILAERIIGRSINSETVLQVSNPLSFDHPASVGLPFGADTLGPIARSEPPLDSAALAVSMRELRYQAVDACLANDSFEQNRLESEEVGIPMLPETEKSDFTLRAEALMVVALTYNRARFAEDDLAAADDKCRRMRVL